jgi:hypothetical protein
VIVHEPEGKQRWINVGFAGFVGTVTGMNASKVAIGEMGGAGMGMWDGMPMAFLMRDALERTTTLEEAVEIFRETPRTCEYYYVISDCKTREAVGPWTTGEVFETMAFGQSYGMFHGMKPRKRGAGGKAFARGLKVEHGKYRTLFKGKGGVEGFIATPPEDTLVLSGYDRYQHFMERLAKAYGKVDHEVMMDLVKRPVSMKSNLHVAIFRPESLEMWVSVAASDGSPACNQPYYRYTLAPSGEQSK